ncbi:MAG: RHS repeat protein [Nitrosomonas sp. PRO4]|nr:RHS repeat protein [Nitrosomonas sp. PRO4]
MAGNFICNKWKQLFSCLLFLLSIGNTSVHGFERGPITYATIGVYFATPYQAVCEYWASRRDTEYVGIPDSQHAAIVSMWVIPWGWNQGVLTMNTLPAVQYQCGVKIHHYGNPPTSPPYDYDWRFGGAYPVCNLGDSPYVPNDTICMASDIVPDKGANAGHPQLGSCVGNPVNTATGNKYAEEVDLISSGGLSFSRYYNSTRLSGSSSAGSSWSHSFQRSLYVNPQTITAMRPDGRTAYFRLTNSVWVNQQAGGDTLTQIAGGTGWQLTTSDDVIETYSTSGKLLSITDRNDRTQTLSYDTHGRLATVTDDTGRALSFTYDGSSRINTMTDPANGVTQYAYDTNGNLTSVIYPDGKTRSYHYNEQAYTSNANLPNALTGIADENGVRFATYTYDTQGRAVVTEHAGGVERYVLGYSTDGSNTIVTDPLNSQYTHHFQTILGVAKSTGQSQPAGSGCSAASSAITYDVNGNVASRADFNGNKTCYAYDLTRNLEIARIEGLGSGSNCPADLLSYTPAANSSERKILTTWHANFRLPTLIAESKRETKYVYDTRGNITQYQIKDTTTNAARTWNTSYSYHASIPGVILQKTENGPRSDVTDVTTTYYYAPDAACTGGHLGCRGQVSSITNALGHVTQIARYNAHGQPEEIIDPNGLTTTLVYDVRQRLLSRTVGAEITSYQYDNAGQLKKITFPDDSFLSYTYDAAHRLTDMADNLGNRVHYTLDNMGNRTKEELFDPGNNLARTQQREYDALSRLWKDIGAQNQITQYQYDAQGNLKQIADPLLHATIFQFDARNRLKQSTDPANGITQHTLDALDRITQVSDPRNIDTTYTYNGFGDVTQEVSADRGTITYTYDPAGNVKTVTDGRGVKHTYTWDALNRPTKRAHATVTGVPGAAQLIWNYDTGTHGIGRLSSMTDESGSTSFSYDAHGRLLAKTQTATIDTVNYTHTLNYQYDNFGRLSQMTYPSGTQVTTTYGADGRPSELRVNGNLLLSNITYQPFGEPKSWTWGNNQAYVRSFDADGRLKTHRVGSDTRTLTYDAASRITQTADTNPVYNRSYDYDALDRLIGQSDNTGFKLWGYDANSNRTNAQIGATNYLYTLEASSNRLQTVAGPVMKTYTYDAAGNPLSDGATTFTWNAAGKLANTVNNAKTHFYKYNALDQRITKNGPLSSKFMFFYDPDGQLIGEYRDNVSTATPTDDWLVRQETIWLEDIPVAVIRKPTATSPIQVYYIHADHLNTPRVIVNTANTIVWRWENTHAFGANLPDEDPDGNAQLFEYHPRFPGQYFDKETNLHYNYFRYYEPETGRYVSPDPIGIIGGVNLFEYANSNSMTFIDSLGLNPLTGASIGAEIGTAILPGVGTVTGAILGSVGGYLIADKLGNIILAKPKPGSKPKNCPAGTIPIDQVPELDKDKIHDIKRGVRAGPRDWTGITPNGDVITGDSEGNAVNNGPYDVFLP